MNRGMCKECGRFYDLCLDNGIFVLKSHKFNKFKKIKCIGSGTKPKSNTITYESNNNREITINAAEGTWDYLENSTDRFYRKKGL